MRGINDLKGLHRVRTVHDAKRSLPRIQTSEYLDLYVLDKEKERLLKEFERQKLRETAIRKRLRKIDNEVSKLQAAKSAARAREKGGSLKRAFSKTNSIKKDWKRMSLSY